MSIEQVGPPDAQKAAAPLSFRVESVEKGQNYKNDVCNTLI